jgi:hypothetical protein
MRWEWDQFIDRTSVASAIIRQEAGCAESRQISEQGHKQYG